MSMATHARRDEVASPATNLRGGNARLVDALESLAIALVALTSRAIEEVASRGEMTLRQWRVLVVLGDAGDGLRVSQVASRISASGSSTTRLVDRLERRGLVSASVDSSDRRALVLRLTPAGEALRSRVLERRRGLIGEAIAGRDLSPAAARELTELASLLEPVG